MKDDYCIQRRKPSDNQINLLLDEVDYLCPLCSEYLFLIANKKIGKKYEIAHIYPNRPTTDQLGILTNVEQLGENSEDPKNLIALCETCHHNYDTNTSLEEYERLVQIKKEKSANHTAKIKVAAQVIEDEISKVLTAIDNINDDDFEKINQLNYEALTVEQKLGMNYKRLKSDIIDDVTQYYSFVRQELMNLDQQDSLKFDTIANQIHTLYLQCASKQQNKEDVFNTLVNRLNNSTNCSRSACKIVISFFVQNCEIYDKVSE